MLPTYQFQRNLVTVGALTHGRIGLDTVSNSTAEPLDPHVMIPPKSLMIVALLLSSIGAACSTNSQPLSSAPSPSAETQTPTQDAATRAQPVVVGRPSRVFVMAGFGTNCEPVPAPTLTVTEQPKHGDISFVVGQETTIAASAQGTCVGQKAKGTGIYYTARAGAGGTDRFAVKAQLASGETSARAFEVTITE